MHMPAILAMGSFDGARPPEHSCLLSDSSSTRRKTARLPPDACSMIRACIRMPQLPSIEGSYGLRRPPCGDAFPPRRDPAETSRNDSPELWRAVRVRSATACPSATAHAMRPPNWPATCRCAYRDLRLPANSPELLAEVPRARSRAPAGPRSSCPTPDAARGPGGPCSVGSGHNRPSR